MALSESTLTPAAARTPVSPRPAEQPTNGTGQPTTLDRLEAVAARTAGLDSLTNGLGALQRLLGTDLEAFEKELAAATGGTERVQNAARHLTELGGKRLRPMCVMLASKLGTAGGLDPRAVDVAVAAELVHSATLLHDDVVDLGDVRRGSPAARTVYGNATSIFAGDWLLIQALKRVRRVDDEVAFPELLDVIEEMILAESIQLETRGTLDLSLESWLRVVEGKTASLFRWAMHAGGRLGGLDADACQHLREFGLHLGVAFQATDDLLDIAGDEQSTGKELFADLREGKMTWPVIAGLARDPSLRSLVEEGLETGNDLPELARRISVSLRQTGALEDCRNMARQRVQLAVGSLTGLPRGPVHDALAAAARAVVERTR